VLGAEVDRGAGTVRYNGHLTTADKKLINHQQNQESKRIYRDKHNNRAR